MEFDDWFNGIWGYSPFPWQRRLAESLAAGTPPSATAAPTATGKTSVIDAWIWALAHHPNQVTRRLWYVVQRRVLVDDAHQRAEFIAENIPDETRRRLSDLSATSEALVSLKLRGGVFEDMTAMDISTPMIVCSTADQHMSRLLFRGYGVAQNSLAIHAALAGTRSTIVVDESHIIPTYESNLRHCANLGADVRVIGMTATPALGDGDVLRFDEYDHAHTVLAERTSKPKLATLYKSKPDKLASLAQGMIKQGCKAVAVFCNSPDVASQIARKIPGAWLLTGRIREYDRQLIMEMLKPLRAGAGGPDRPTIVVATQTLEVGADLDFDGLVTESASLSSLRQRFGRLNRLGNYEAIQGAIVWDGKKTTPVYGESAANVFKWMKESFQSDVDMSTTAIDRALLESPPAETLEQMEENGPRVTQNLLDTWCQTNPRPLWDVEVDRFISPSDDTTIKLVWRGEPAEAQLVESFPPHPREAAPVPISAVRKWAGERSGIRWRGSGTALLTTSADLRPGDVWVLEVEENDGRAELGCTLKSAPADVADIPGERIRADERVVDLINDGASLDELAEATGIERPVVSPRGNQGYMVSSRNRVGSLSSNEGQVELEAHSFAVADLACEMAKKLRVDQDLLYTAGVLHDIGKSDPRMQAWMGSVGEGLLAKSGMSGNALTATRPPNLPKGWRHEMLSYRMVPEGTAPQLLDLIATHHGRCRPSPPKHSDDGFAAIEFAGLSLSSRDKSSAELVPECIQRFGEVENIWENALRQSILMMSDRIASRDNLVGEVKSINIGRGNESTPSPSFVASALDGTSLLGWLAAVGALRVLSEETRTYLSWSDDNRAEIIGWSRSDAIEYLEERMKVPPPVSRPTTTEDFESMGIWGPAVWRSDGKDFKQSPLIATGGGQTGLERAWPKLAASMNAQKIQEALVGPWVYYKKLGQRWDSAEHAEHGSQWSDPSKDGSQSVHGANRLAIEALPLLPTLIGRTTIGFDNSLQAAAWPLWRAPLTVEGVRVSVRQPMPERWMSRKIGVAQLSSFLPAEPCERSSS